MGHTKNILKNNKIRNMKITNKHQMKLYNVYY